MSQVFAQEVRSLILSHLAPQLAAKGMRPEEVPDDFDLLAEGVVDSLGIVELISAIEKQFDIHMDFEDLDPENLTVIGPFCRFVEEKSITNHNPKP